MATDAIARGTTPTITMTLPNTYDVSTADTAYLSFGQGQNDIFDIPLNRLVFLSGYKIEATLTQAETLKLLSEAMVSIQLRWKKSGLAYATKKVKMDVDGIIKDGEI